MKYCAPCEVPGCEHISLDNLIVAVPGPHGHVVLVLCSRHNQARKLSDARALRLEMRRRERVPVKDEFGFVHVVHRNAVA